MLYDVLSKRFTTCSKSDLNPNTITTLYNNLKTPISRIYYYTLSTSSLVYGGFDNISSLQQLIDKIGMLNLNTDLGCIIIECDDGSSCAVTTIKELVTENVTYIGL